MITCFPDPHPDEIFYSLCARYANRMKYSAKTAVTRDLFGSNAPLVNIAFPSRLGTLVANLVLATWDIRSENRYKILREDQHGVKKSEWAAFNFILSQSARK